MLDCEKVPETCEMETWEESWSGTSPSRDPKGEALVKTLIQELRNSGKKLENPTSPVAIQNHPLALSRCIILKEDSSDKQGEPVPPFHPPILPRVLVRQPLPRVRRAQKPTRTARRPAPAPRARRFVDPHFPAADASLFADPRQTLGANADVQQSFRRARPPARAYTCKRTRG